MNVDNILEEVNGYEEPKAVMPKKETKPEKVAKKTNPLFESMSKETAMHMLKRLAFMGFVGGCAWLKLMHPVLYIPAEILALCSLCIKYGEWRGMKGE